MARLPTRAPARKSGASAPAFSLRSALDPLYPAPEWGVFTDVRSSTGVPDVLRIADAIAVQLLPSSGWRIHGFEVKRSRSDWLRELRTPEQSGPLKLFCACWYLVVPAPWKRVLLGVSELPDLWGLIEIGTGGATVVAAATERRARAEEPTSGFVLALLRAAAQGGGDVAGEDLAHDAPHVVVTRPRLSRDQVGLACGHVAVKPLSKIMPRTLPCFSCKDGRASDRAFIEAAIEEATDEDLADYAHIIERRRSLRAA